MKERYTLNTVLAVVVGLGCLAAVLCRSLLPAAVLPDLGLPAAAGLIAGSGAVRFAVVSGAAFLVLTFLFTSLRERLLSGGAGRLALLFTSIGLFLACQCFAGMIL